MTRRGGARMRRQRDAAGILETRSCRAVAQQAAVVGADQQGAAGVLKAARTLSSARRGRGRGLSRSNT